MFLSLVRNEIEKTWRSRWIVFAVLMALFVLLASALYAYYVYRFHTLSPPAAIPWQTQLHRQIDSNQQVIDSLRRLKPQQGGFVSVGVGGPFGRPSSSLDSAIAQNQQAMAADQYLLDNDIAPLQSYSITRAVLFALGGIVMFVLIRIFGWLASEQIAGERSDGTIAILLSRPASRDQVLLAKAVASFLTSLAVLVASFLIVYAMFSFIFGGAGPVTGQVGIAIDGSKRLGPDNLVVLPIPVFVLMSLGGAMLAVLCVQGMSLLISVVTGRWAAIGLTLAVLFAAGFVSTVVSAVIGLISGGPGAARFLNYAFFNVLAPVGSIAPVLGNGPTEMGKGMSEFSAEVKTLAVWAVAFFAAAWFLFHRKQEAG